jgi:hypothetical protein
MTLNEKHQTAKATRRRTVWSEPATAGKRAGVGWHGAIGAKEDGAWAEGAGMEFVICASRKQVLRLSDSHTRAGGDSLHSKGTERGYRVAQRRWMK